MRLEDCLPGPLRISSADRKQQLIGHGVAVWVFKDGELVGECYGAPASFAQDPDIMQYGDDPEALCMFGCCVFPTYQGQGYAKLILSYWLALAKVKGFGTVVGHAAHPAMAQAVRTFGAEILAERENWGGSGRVGHLFRITV